MTGPTPRTWMREPVVNGDPVGLAAAVVVVDAGVSVALVVGGDEVDVASVVVEVLVGRAESVFESSPPHAARTRAIASVRTRVRTEDDLGTPIR